MLPVMIHLLMQAFYIVREKRVPCQAHYHFYALQVSYVIGMINGTLHEAAKGN